MAELLSTKGCKTISIVGMGASCFICETMCGRIAKFFLVYALVLTPLLSGAPRQQIGQQAAPQQPAPSTPAPPPPPIAAPAPLPPAPPPPAIAAGQGAGITNAVFPSFANTVERLLPCSVSILATMVPEMRQREGMDDSSDSPFAQGSPFEDLLKEFFKNYLNKEQRPQKAMGSGFIVKITDTEIEIATNYHVVKDAKKVTVVFNNRIELRGNVKGSDERTDVAVVSVSLVGVPDEKVRELRAKIRFVEWGDSDAVRPGDWAIAIGNPFGLGGSATFGPVSSKGRDLMIGGAASGRRTEYVDDFIQHQCPINVGNSGGMLVEAATGRVIGINTAILTPTGVNVGVGFAIPSAVAKKVVESISKFGRVVRAGLGVAVQSDITPEMWESLRLKDLGLLEHQGAIVVTVAEGGPASKAICVSPGNVPAGLKSGDVIYKFQGKVIDKEKNRLMRLVGESEIGPKIRIEVIRDHKLLTFETVLVEFEESQKGKNGATFGQKKAGKAEVKDHKLEILGLTLTPVPDALKKDVGFLKDAEGVYVYSTNKTDYHLFEGDIIDSCALIETKKKINSLGDFSQAVSDAKARGLKNLLLSVRRRSAGTVIGTSAVVNLYVTIPLLPEESQSVSILGG